MSEIDYKVAFEELTTLNRLFSDHHEYPPPRLGTSFVEVGRRGTSLDTDELVYRGALSGCYYLTRRSQRAGLDYTYSGFIHVQPVERIITDWLGA